STARIIAALPPPQDGVAAALMTGERSAVPASILDSMRDSGLAHLLAISGLHIGLVAGILFAAVRAGLVMVPGVALRYPVKKCAAVAAIAGAFIYALIAGATLPTQRAFLMIALALLGVILDRRGLSLRSVAWAALVILALQPESLLGASFQMSFAAVVALVAAYEYLTQRRRRLGREAGPRRWHQTLGRYLIGIAITSLVAGAATAPFAVYHFNRFADYGLVANMLAVPLTGFWVMPWAIIGFVLMPFGAEAVGLVPMGWGIAAVVAVAETVAGWPGAVTLLPAMPIWGLAAIALGGLWLCIWRYRWRVWGAAGVAAGLATIFTMQPPDILVDGGGRVLAVRGADGGLIASTVRRARFQQEIWARLGGDEDQPRLLPTAGRAGEGAISCDAEGCLYRRNGRIAALIRQESAATEDCWTADVVIALVPLRRRCPAAHVIDRFDLWRSGSHAVWMTGVKVRVETVDGYRGRRPWVVGPAARRDGTGGAS
ncbi:MAG: ComEC/Rec2 family competence protein, partial [Magnetovibrio sp.]|nr:ComEC/Rec2 family competence protein [Magnetovibrio sp.]